MLKIKIIPYNDPRLNDFIIDDYDLFIVTNSYEQEFKILNSILEFDDSVKMDLTYINKYVMDCYDADNGVPDLNLHYIENW